MAIERCLFMSNKENREVQIGDIYQDRDRRAQGRKVQVVKLEDDTAICLALTAKDGAPLDNNKTTRIKIRRLQTNAYQWLENVPLKTDTTEQSQTQLV